MRRFLSIHNHRSFAVALCAVALLAAVGGVAGCSNTPPPTPGDPVHAGDDFSTRPGKGKTQPTATATPAP
jgi:hypothetical protein